MFFSFLKLRDWIVDKIMMLCEIKGNVEGSVHCRIKISVLIFS
jgi:hypothetical protein